MTWPPVSSVPGANDLGGGIPTGIRMATPLPDARYERRTLPARRPLTLRVPDGQWRLQRPGAGWGPTRREPQRPTRTPPRRLRPRHAAAGLSRETHQLPAVWVATPWDVPGVASTPSRMAILGRPHHVAVCRP